MPSPRTGSKRTHRCPPDHPHGANSTCYGAHKCGCDPCVDNHAEDARARRRDIAYGRHQPFLDSAPVLAKIERLRAENWTWPQIAKAGGVSRVSVGALYRERHTKVTRRMHDGILGITTKPPKDPKGRVDATGTRRRLQALVAHGWTSLEIAERLGVNDSNMAGLIRAKGCSQSMHDRVVALYEVMSTETPPPNKFRRTRANTIATKNRWLGPQWWVDLDMDDPTVQPDVVEDEPGWIVAELAHLYSLGESPAQAAIACGRTRAGLAKIARSHGRADLSRWIADNTTAAVAA